MGLVEKQSGSSDRLARQVAYRTVDNDQSTEEEVLARLSFIQITAGYTSHKTLSVTPRG